MRKIDKAIIGLSMATLVINLITLVISIANL